MPRSLRRGADGPHGSRPSLGEQAGNRRRRAPLRPRRSAFPARTCRQGCRRSRDGRPATAPDLACTRQGCRIPPRGGTAAFLTPAERGIHVPMAVTALPQSGTGRHRSATRAGESSILIISWTILSNDTKPAPCGTSLRRFGKARALIPGTTWTADHERDRQ